MNKYYEYERCNIHRSDFAMSDRVAEQVYDARRSVANLINAEPEQIMFTSGATESLNIVAEWYSNTKQVIISEAEHNANIIPWIVRNKTLGNGLVVLPIQENFGTVNVDDAIKAFEKAPPGSLLSMASISNATGIESQWRVMVAKANARGLATCIDACQSIMHSEIDVKKTPVDYLLFSGHKMFGPTGVGVLYSRNGFGNHRPVRFGGGGAEHVSFSDVVFYNDVARHEVGTQNIAGILGLGTAAELISFVGYNEIRSKLSDLAHVLGKGIGPFDIIYPVEWRESIFSFRSSINPSDISGLLGQRNIAVRSGKLCAHPIVNKLSNNGLLRISTAPYNTHSDVERLTSELTDILKKLA